MNKKILLAAAVAVACGAPVAAMADANIYGQFRYSVNSMDHDDGAGSSLSGNDNVSLFGLKASAGDDVKAFVHLQTGAVADANASGAAFNQRFYFGGLKGGFGTVAYGRMSTAYKMAGFNMDPFYNLSHVGADGTLSTALATYGLSPATNGFTDNAIQYTSPAMSGLKINVGMYLDDTANDDHGTGVGVAYSADNFNVGVQFVSNDATGTVAVLGADNEAMRIHGGYKADSWSADISYETVDNTGGTADKTYTFLVGKYNMSKELQLVLTYGMVDDDNDGADEGAGYTLGAFQTVAPKTQVYASYSAASLDNTGGPDTGADPTVFSVGAIHKF